METPLAHFNANVGHFIDDLKAIFGSADKDIVFISTAFDVTKYNARIFIEPFQRYVVNNDVFVENIMKSNATFFVNYRFEDIIPTTDHSFHLLNKFREATIRSLNKPQTLDAIFNWFKVLIYYALSDLGKDPSLLPGLNSDA